MKKLLLICALSVCTGVWAQDSLRNFRLSARTPKGKPVPELDLTARLARDTKTVGLDRFGNRYFKVADADTLIVEANSAVYVVPLDGLDSLELVFKHNRKLLGERRKDIIVDIGYGTISKANLTTSVGHIDMKGAEYHTDLKKYIEGRVANLGSVSLIIVDGVQFPSFATANAMIRPSDVESISVLKRNSTIIYGVAGGTVLIITTKLSRDKSADRGKEKDEN